MYCFKCGRQIREDALFCQYCGAEQKINRNVVTKQRNNTGELDRDALKIYLGNLLSLESIKANYKRRRGEFSYWIYCNKGNYYKQYTLQEGAWNSHYIHFLYDGEKIYVSQYSPGSPFLSNASPDINGGKWFCIEDGSDAELLDQVGYLSEAHDHGAGFFKRRKQVEEAQSAFLDIYATFKRDSQVIFQNTANRIENYQNTINGIDAELETIDRMLKKAYDANIIPEMFRNNIHAIYYLYNFISTSQESFTTALLHFDLDEIKKKLDKIIAQQETIIIQQAVMNSQNQQLLRQNQQQLEHLARIETNTSQAAQYAQIAASNAETCAWISVANYIEAHRG